MEITVNIGEATTALGGATIAGLWFGMLLFGDNGIRRAIYENTNFLVRALRLHANQIEPVRSWSGRLSPAEKSRREKPRRVKRK